MQLSLSLLQEAPVELCETLKILEPWFKDQGIEYIEHIERSDRVHLKHESWKSGGRLIRVKGTKIIGPGGRDFDLYSPLALGLLVAYLHMVSR